MGREIRRVPPDWTHPTEMEQYGKFGGSYPRNSDEPHPLYDRSYAEACAEWKRDYAAWEARTHPDLMRTPDLATTYEFWDWQGMPPDRAYFRDREWTCDEATAFQVYETVSEGTPVSPVFASPDDLKAWLVTEHGMSAEGADNFIGDGFVPAMVVRRDPSGAVETAVGFEAAEPKWRA